MDVRSRLCLLFLFSVSIVVRCKTEEVVTELQTETALITDLVEDESVTDLITTIPPMEDLMTTSLETSLPAVTCANHDCGSHGTCIGNETFFIRCNCDNFSRLVNDYCEELSCDTTDRCKGPGDVCYDHHGGYMCFCNETLNRFSNQDQSDCVERSPSTLEPNVMTTQPGDQTSMTSGTSGTTNSTGATNAPDTTVAPGTSKPSTPKGVTDKTPEVTEGTGSSEAGTAAPASSHQSEKISTAAPDEIEPSSDHSYTGAIIGLFIFLVATAFLFVAIYLVRRRKLRNNYGRLDEDTEGDGGWSAFSKNPIYRGDKDYQPL